MFKNVSTTFGNNMNRLGIRQSIAGIHSSSRLLATINQSSEEYQFLERSKIPTLHFQKSLPRLPIPELKKTCERYLAAQQPISTSEEFSEIQKLVAEFQNGEGPKLDEKLRAHDKANKHTSYISGPWFDMYLRDRVPLPLNYNPALVFVNAVGDLNNQLIRTTNLVVSSLRFMKSLRAGILSPDVYHLNPAKSDTELFRNVVRLLPESISYYGAYLYKAYPLDMSQYSSLFNSTRIPKPEKDVLFKNEKARHLVVLRKGNFYKVDVLDENNRILPAADIQACLRYILSLDSPANLDSIGMLTGGCRDEWAAAREHILSIDQSNVNSLHDVDSAIFALCLDDDNVGDDAKHGMRKFLHGDGFNRWFDKSFSMIVAKDGTAGLNFEHSWGDGVAILHYFTDVLKDSNRNPFVNRVDTVSSVDPTTLVSEIKFKLDQAAKDTIAKTKDEFDRKCKELAIDIMQIPGFGKQDCKKAKISPDSVMQLAFQVAYHKVNAKFVATYESCSTAAFKHGRTETVRPCTMATRDFTLAFNKNTRPSDQELIQMMQKCSAVHNNLTKEAAMGNGFDRHLFGLRCQAVPNIPAIYTHPSYAKINHNILSTSTLSSEHVLFGGFGPVVKDGLGVGYNILDKICGSAVTSYPPHGDGAAFIAALEETIKGFATLLSPK